MASMASRPNLGHNTMNWKTLIALAMCTVLPGIHLAVSCQDNENEPNSISCEIPPNSNRYNELWATMDSVHQEIGGELSILHLGGSHVQAGWIGHFMREQLALWSPQAIWSKGLMLPYRLAKTNTPTHFRTEMSGHWQGSRCTRKSWDEINSDVGSGTGIQVRTVLLHQRYNTSLSCQILRNSQRILSTFGPMPDRAKFHSSMRAVTPT